MVNGTHPDGLSQAYDTSDAQAIVNELPIPARRAQVDCDIPVTARVVWERDGEEQIMSRAMAHTARAVLVTVTDRRRPMVVGVWLPPEDVERT